MIELELAPHYEKLADSHAEDYERIANALGNPPLYHQWCTYRAKHAHIVVNSYNTGTGKTKAALLRLLDLDEAYKKSRYNNANVLFIAPTNELLRQHEQDVLRFINDNGLSHIVLRLDAATIKELGNKHLGGKFVRQGDRLHQMLQDPGSVLTDSDGYHIEGHHPYVLVINPDIFYYALYGLGNPHDQKVLFRAFIKNFSYIVVDEFHYYNAKQLANFLFFLTLLREWGYFSEGRRICLLTATPVQQVQDYLSRLNLDIEYIKPGNDPPGLPTIPALAPVRLRLYSADALEDGLVSLATSEKSMVLDWLQQGRHGAFISSALWRINRLYQEFGGKDNQRLGRLTGAENREWRAQSKNADLLMATPTVDIGYNFERLGKKRQNIDFLLFDSRSSDEFIQRLGRGGRVLGKDEFDIPSDVWAVVPDELLTELGKLVGKKVERSELNQLVNETLSPKNGIYAYISSGAVAEAFLPLYRIKRSLPTDQAEQAEQAERLYEALCQVYRAARPLSFKRLIVNTKRYLEIKSRLPELLHDANAERFSFGPASVIVRTMDEQPDVDLDKLEEIDEARARQVEQRLQQKRRAREAELRRQAEIEEYYATDARFNFRDNFQPPLALAHDPKGLLATAEFTIYSALHIVQNYFADWFDSVKQGEEWIEKAGGELDEQVKLYCDIRQLREQRLSIYFKLNSASLTKREWEKCYCSKLTATRGFRLLSDNGPVVLATWNIRSEKGLLRAIYKSHFACSREVAKVESESIPVFHTLVPFFLFVKEKLVFPVLISIRQRIALCFNALHDSIVRWMKPHSTSLLLGTIADLARGKSELLVENALLRQQVIILRRQVKRPACGKTDRFLLLFLARMIRTWRQALFIVQPETLLRWHRELFRLFWKHRSKTDSRQPKLSPETITLIKEIVKNNRLWGAERIRGELLKLGISVCKRTIQKYMRQVRVPRPRGQKWATFLHNHAADVWACDFLLVTDLFFRSLFIFFIIELKSRKVIHVGVTGSPTDAWTAQQLREATPYGQTPKYLIRDNDSKFGPCYARVAVTSDIEILTTPYHAPRANAICERFLGSVRRECLDHILVLHEKQLHRVLRTYVEYFNRARPHQGIRQQVPEREGICLPSAQSDEGIISVPVLGGLHHEYRRVA